MIRYEKSALLASLAVAAAMSLAWPADSTGSDATADGLVQANARMPIRTTQGRTGES